MPSLKTLIAAAIATELILGGAAYNLKVGFITGLVPAVGAHAVRAHENAAVAPPNRRNYKTDDYNFELAEPGREERRAAKRGEGEAAAARNKRNYKTDTYDFELASGQKEADRVEMAKEE